MSKKLTGIPSLAYKGVEAASPPNIIQRPDVPSTVDQAWVRVGYHNTNVCDLWLKRLAADAVPYELWLQVDKRTSGDGIKQGRWIQLYPQAGGAGATIHRTDVGDAVPVGSLLNVPGGTGIDTAGAGNTMTISVDQTVPTTFGSDSGNAVPVGNTITVSGGDNVNTSAAGAIVTVNLNKSVLQPVTNLAGTEGVYALGAVDFITNRFLHNYGASNTFVGAASGRINATLTGSANVGVGDVSLGSLTSGGDNTNIGSGSGDLISSGDDNCGLGSASLGALTTGNRNISLGSGSLIALVNGSDNIAIGNDSANLYVGAESNNIIIGNAGVAAENGIIRLGTIGTQTQSYMAGIWQNAPAGVAEIVRIDSTGQLGSYSGLDGEVLIGVTGGSPTWSTLTAGAGIGIAQAAGSITITNTGGGGGGTVNSVTGGTNINTTGTAADPIVNLNSSIQQPITAVDGSDGVYALGATVGFPGAYITDRFMHAYGTRNTFLGADAGRINVGLTGVDSVGIGESALTSLTSGIGCVMVGSGAGTLIDAADDCVGVGFDSLALVTSGNNNTALGRDSLNKLLTGTDNLALGYQSGTNYTGAEDSNILLNNDGTVADSNTIRIGTQGAATGQQDKAFMAGIWQVIQGGGTEFVTVDASGQFGSVTAGVGVLSVTAGTNIILTGTAVDPIVNVTNSIHLPTTTAAGTSGVLAIGSGGITDYTLDRMVHRFGTNNTFCGRKAGNMTLTSTNCTAVGHQSMENLTSGLRNCALGNFAATSLTVADEVTALGSQAGRNITSGGNNSLVGRNAGLGLTSSIQNTVIGSNALEDATSSAISSTFVGFQAGQHMVGTTNDTMIGTNTAQSWDIGSHNVVIGYNAGSGVTDLPSESNIYVLNAGVNGEDNTIRLGTDGFADGQQDTTYIAGIYNQQIVSSTRRFMVIENDHQLGYDTDLSPRLSPTFHYDLTGTQSNVTGDGTEYYMGTNGGASAIFTSFYDTTGGDVNPGNGAATRFRFTPTTLGVYAINFQTLIGDIPTTAPPPVGPAPIDPVRIYLRNAAAATLRQYEWIGLPITYDLGWQTFPYSTQVAFQTAGDYIEFAVQIVLDPSALVLDVVSAISGHKQTFIQGTFLTPLT